MFISAFLSLPVVYQFKYTPLDIAKIHPAAEYRQ